MNIGKVRDYWVEEGEEALRVAWHLVEKQDYSYSLFFGHLAVEKFLKAVYVVRKKKQPPYIHNLKRLAEESDIPLAEQESDDLIKITAFNLESRYPDEKRSFRKICTPEFTKKELKRIEGIIQWLKSML